MNFLRLLLLSSLTTLCWGQIVCSLDELILELREDIEDNGTAFK